jgi:hypothetical protein
MNDLADGGARHLVDWAATLGAPALWVRGRPPAAPPPAPTESAPAGRWVAGTFAAAGTGRRHPPLPARPLCR